MALPTPSFRGTIGEVAAIQEAESAVFGWTRRRPAQCHPLDRDLPSRVPERLKWTSDGGWAGARGRVIGRVLPDPAGSQRPIQKNVSSDFDPARCDAL